ERCANQVTEVGADAVQERLDVADEKKDRLLLHPALQLLLLLEHNPGRRTERAVIEIRDRRIEQPVFFHRGTADRSRRTPSSRLRRIRDPIAKWISGAIFSRSGSAAWTGVETDRKLSATSSSAAIASRLRFSGPLTRIHASLKCGRPADFERPPRTKVRMSSRM